MDISSDPKLILHQIKICVQNQNRWRGTQTLNMIASENVMSHTAQSQIASDFGHRYAEGLVHERAYQGQQYQDEIEDICNQLAKQVFHADFVDVRPPTATTANLAIFFGLCKPRDPYMALDVPAGAHISYRKFGSAGCRDLDIQDIPFDEAKFNLDLDGLAQKMAQFKPKLLTLGASVFLFPHPVKDVKKICDEFGTILHYDGSHVLGLIAGGEFSQPLAEGADILLGSTHKTFPGPQGAVVLSSNRDNNPKYFKKVQRAIFPGLVSNHHLWRLPPLAITLLEMREFGAHYAKQVIANAQALAKALDRESIPVLAKSLGYTQSHQVLVDVAEFGGGGTAAKQLEIANIICNKNLLSKDDINKAMENPSGLRLGTQEMTRWGLKEGDMKTVAHFFRQIIIDKESPEKIQKEVISFRSKFDTIQFSLDGNK